VHSIAAQWRHETTARDGTSSFLEALVKPAFVVPRRRSLIQPEALLSTILGLPDFVWVDDAVRRVDRAAGSPAKVAPALRAGPLAVLATPRAMGLLIGGARCG